MPRFRRKLRLTIVICVFFWIYINFVLDPVYLQSIHRYVVRHEILRGDVVKKQETHSKSRLCREKLSFPGEMCPKPYSDIASCELSEDGFSCPDIRRKGNTTLRQAQLVVTRMLRVFDLIARKHNLPYWVRSGSLIGAIRHNGFIPWDDDIDIEMPLMYYIDFFEKFSRELPDDMFFQTSKTDLTYHRPKSIFNIRSVSDRRVGVYGGNWRPKVRDRSSCYKYCLKKGCTWHDGLQLDIFVTDSIPWGIFPLREMSFEGFNILVPNRWKSVIADEYPQFMDLPREAFRLPKNIDVDPLHSCEALL
ncbi:uncharacterized protein LOC111335462 [Stylophora pistillata]|uniref:uncharacterized protein LOC111335462 n=1 Tax=Stylophora pistillata TaxID=50429 RepID=UPI000C05057E|nr:uncharacterized protein LOC111335462 [Stylophora pistillata]